MPLLNTPFDGGDFKAMIEGKRHNRTTLIDAMIRNHTVGGDVYRFTVYHNTEFHAYMDTMATLSGIGHGDRNWRSWNFRRVRMYAKSWSFAASYGVGETMTGRFQTATLNVTEKER